MTTENTLTDDRLVDFIQFNLGWTIDGRLEANDMLRVGQYARDFYESKISALTSEIQLMKEQVKQTMETITEKIVCAAIWYMEMPTSHCLPVNIDSGVVVSGLRHPHCIATFVSLSGKRSVTPECGNYIQGFITTKDRFVNRVEALDIAKKAGQIISNASIIGNQLYSEDIY